MQFIQHRTLTEEPILYFLFHHWHFTLSCHNQDHDYKQMMTPPSSFLAQHRFSLSTLKTLPTPPHPRSLRHWLSKIIILSFMITLLICAGIVMALLIPSTASSKQTIIIPRQIGLRAIGDVLASHNLVHHSLQFSWPAKLLGSDNLKAGEYEFPARISVLDIIALLRTGKSVVHKLTIPEGLTNADIARLLDAEPLLTEATGTTPAEGRLFPATYHFSYGDSRPQLLDHMARLAQQTLQELWAKRAPGLPFATPEQALTLASIVEKETGLAIERPRVAGVFINRLRQGIKLQSDPTVIYALTQGKAALKRGLTSADLTFPSPYNTYFTMGLPPAPIANPGRAALEAVLHPEKHEFLYFVADGSGGHAFAKTLDEHNKNVARWRKLRD